MIINLKLNYCFLLSSDVLNPDRAGDAGFADDFLNMMGDVSTTIIYFVNTGMSFILIIFIFNLIGYNGQASL